MGFLIYDGIVVAILAIFAWLGWRRGLLLSLCGLAVAVVSFLGAGLLADTFDAPLAETFTPNLEVIIEERISAHSEDLGVTTAVDALREEKGLFGWAADVVEETLGNSQLAHDASSVVSTAAQAIATQIAHTVLFALAFVLFYVLLTILLHALNLVAKLPGLHFCNGLGGGVIGLVKGGLIVFVAVAVLMTSSHQPTMQTLESTKILKFFVENNPILLLLGG